MTYYMYTSISGENKILIHTMDPETGLVQHKGEVELHDGPVPLAVDPEGKFLYTALRATHEVLSFRIDPGTGGLEQLGSTKLQETPCYLLTDRTGKFLFGAHYSTGAVSVNPINKDGVATDLIQWLETDLRAHCVQIDSSNRFVLVPHVMPGNAVFQLELNQETGALTPNAVPKVVPEVEEGPRHCCFHPGKDIVYTSNEQGSSVTAYHFDATAGTLSPFQTIPNLPPEGYDPEEGGEENSCSQIAITPAGKFLYAPNRGHNSMACFRVDEQTGKLSTIGYQAIEKHTRGISLDPQGKFLYATGAASGRMATFCISEQTGALEPLENFAVGEGPMWVQFVIQPD
jgi:6-phosphogluconolactonase